MNNLDELKFRIDELRTQIEQRRQTGRSSQLVNAIIDKFFNEPIGTPIQVRDHYWGENVGIVDGKYVIDYSHHELNSPERMLSIKMADKILLGKVAKRLDNEYLGVRYIIDIKSYPYTITRTTLTFTEQAQKEIDSLQKILDEEANKIKSNLENDLK